MERCEAEIKRLERLIRDHSSRESVRRSEENVTAPALMLPTVTWTGWGNILLSIIVVNVYHPYVVCTHSIRTRWRRAFTGRKAQTSASFETH